MRGSVAVQIRGWLIDDFVWPGFCEIHHFRLAVGYFPLGNIAAGGLGQLEASCTSVNESS
jgi:hypothetical protein